MRVRIMRVLAISAAAIAVLILIALIAIHTNPIQARVLSWSVAELERRFDLDLTADDLHYNLAARRVTLTNVRLAAIGHHDNPFFTAQAVTVRFPWVAYAGTLRFDEIDVERGVVTITRDEQDRSNLPPGKPRDPNAPVRRIDARNLTVRSLDFVYRDRLRAVEIDATGVRADLDYELGRGAIGRFEIDRGVRVSTRAQQVTVEPLKGRMAFDGSNIELENVGLATSDGTFVVDGPIKRVLDQPTLNLQFKGTTDLDVAKRWTTPPMTLAGPASIEATMKGAPSEFVLDARVTSQGSTVGTERAVAIDAEARLTPNGLSVTRSTITPSTGGSVEATADVEFGQHSRWWVAATWQGVDAAAAFRLAEVPPLAFGAALTGRARIESTAGEPFRLEAHNESQPRNARGTAPLSGVVDFLVERNRWRATQRHRVGVTLVDGPLGGIWNRQSVTQSTFEGQLTVRTGNVGEAARFAALFGFAAPAIVRDATGPAEASVQMGGVFVQPRFTGSLSSAEGVDLPYVGVAAFSANYAVSPSALSATDVEAVITSTAALGSSRTNLSGNVAADLVRRGLSGQFVLDTPSAADLLSALPEALRLNGPLTANATLAGTVDAPEVHAEIKGADLTLSGQPVDSLDAKARVVDGGVTIDSLTLNQGQGTLRATGRYEWADRTYSIDVTGEDLSWRGTLARLGDAEARFGLKFAGEGDIDHPTGVGVIEFNLTGGLAGELIDKGIANVRLDGNSARVTGAIPSLGAFIDSTIQPRHPFDYQAVIVMNRIDLPPVVALAGLEEGHVTGSVSLSATAKGQLAAIVESQAFINLQDISADVSGVPVRLAAPSRLSWDGAGLSIDTLDVTLGTGRLIASGRFEEAGLTTAKWDSQFTGELGDLLRIGRPFGAPSDLNGSGPVSMTWRSMGGLERSTATVQLSGGTVTWAELPPVLDLRLDADFDGATLDVTRLTGEWQDGSIEGTASIPRALLESQGTSSSSATGPAGFAKLRVTGLTESALTPFVSPAVVDGIDGLVSAALDAQITSPTLEGVHGSLTFDEAAFVLAGVKVAQVRPSVLDIGDGVVTMKDVAFDAGGSPLTLKGAVHLTPPDKQVLNLTLDGTVDLRAISAFVPGVATDGEAKLNLGIGGPLREPLLSGRVDLADAEMAIREPRILVSEVNGTLALDGQRVLFDSVRGSINGGELALDGGFLLEGFTPARGGLTMVVDGAALQFPGALQSEISALVTLEPSGTGWTLTGDINVERSVYTEPISLGALIGARGARVPAAPTDRSWGDQLRLNLFVSTLQDLQIDNNYGRMEAGAALRIGGSVGQPSVGGRVTLREGGEVFLAGNTFVMSRGSISFTSPHRIVPEFDIEMRTLIAGSDIILTLSGPLDRLQTDARSSDPTIDSREALTMLLGGSGEDAVALLSAELLLGGAGRAIGLDTLRVQRGFETEEYRADPGLIATETDPSTRLTISKRLRPNVELILSQSLRESGELSAIIAYRPRRNIEIRGVSRDNLDRAISMRHEITFGGSSAASAASSTPPPRVSDIVFSGEPGRPTSELLRLLRLRVGQRFQFHDWQRDVDRLREEFQNQNRYEARVRGLRQLSEDGATVVLEYRIEPGPVTELVVEGHPLERELEQAIRDAWRRTIFDRFLLEDIEAQILRHMMEENVIGSKVETSVAVSTPERKQVRVNVTAGTQVRGRSVQYTGNQGFDNDRLDVVVQDAGLTVAGWLDPPRLADALARFYRDQGYLSVTVKADQPMVEGDRGVLPVTINEGPRFVLGRLSFPGVSPERLASVAGAARLDAGIPFVTAEIDAARRRIEDLYAAEGFNQVQLEVEAEPDTEAATVAIEFAILEGVQQVLREVVASGATRTRDGVLRRTLRLRAGEPVNLADWSQARKRLYDTNVFREVDIQPLALPPTTEESAAGIEPVRAVVRVVEYPVWRLRYGAQFNDEKSDVPEPDGTQPRAQSLGVLADLQNQNLFGRAITAGISGRYERNRQAASMFTSNSSFFGLPIRSGGYVFYSRQRFVDDLMTTIDQRSGVNVEQRWRPYRFSELIWGYRFERAHVFDPDALPPSLGDPIPLDVISQFSGLTTAMVLDRRDNLTSPSRGWLMSATWDQSLKALGSDFTSGKMLLRQSMYREAGPFILAGRVQFGAGYGGEGLVSSERFQLGGATTVRGYAENSLGPRDAGGFPIGGDALFALNGELRFPIRGWLHGVTFLDAGNVFATRQDISFSDLATGYGFGLRVVSPFLLLRVDFGIPGTTISPNRPANQFRSGRFYFGIGHIF